MHAVAVPRVISDYRTLKVLDHTYLAKPFFSLKASAISQGFSPEQASFTLRTLKSRT